MTDNKTNQTEGCCNRNMKAWLPYILTGVVSFIVGFGLGVLTHVLALRKDRHDRLRAFRDNLAVLVDKFATAKDADLFSIHQQSIEQFGEAAARIGEDIRPERRYDFKRACRYYCGMSEQDIRNFDADHITYELFKGVTGAKPPKTSSVVNYKFGRQKIIDLLIKLRDFSR